TPGVERGGRRRPVRPGLSPPRSPLALATALRPGAGRLRASGRSARGRRGRPAPLVRRTRGRIAVGSTACRRPPRRRRVHGATGERLDPGRESGTIVAGDPGGWALAGSPAAARADEPRRRPPDGPGLRPARAGRRPDRGGRPIGGRPPRRAARRG